LEALAASVTTGFGSAIVELLALFALLGAGTGSVVVVVAVAGLVALAEAAAVEVAVGAASGRAKEDAMMAGSTGAPGTVGWPVGGRRAGGVYLLGWPDWSV
jgi:hypothetical protein